jgi:Uma2 family endonuclease
MHGKPHGAMTGLLYAYVARTPGVQMANNATVFLDADNELQPDVCLFREPAPPGGARVTEEDYIEGAPQLVVEIAASSASYVLHDKLRAYRRAGVEEYVVWQVLEREIIWLRLMDGEYVRVQPDATGVIESSALPGLRLAVAAMLAGNFQAVLAALD